MGLPRLVRTQRVSLLEAARRRLLGRPRVVRSRQIHRNAQIGDGTVIGDAVLFLSWLPTERIVIGRFCSIGERSVIFIGGNHRTDTASTFAFDFFLLDQRFPSRTYQTTPNTVIGNDVWIGRDSMIMGGVHIGDGAVIAAGSVVVSDVPPYAIAAGNPARVVRYRFSRRTVERMLRIAWWDWPEDKLSQNMEWLYRPINEFVAHFDPEYE